jgi:hypothetical protein
MAATRVLPLLLILCCMQFGCMATTYVWNEATETGLWSPRLVGAVHGDVLEPQRATELVFMYMSDVTIWRYPFSTPPDGAGDYFVSVPLDADGFPPKPLAYRGDRKLAVDVWADIPVSDQAAAGEYRFGRDAFARAKVAQRLPTYVAFGLPPPPPAPAPGAGAYWDSPWGLRLFGIAPDGTPVGGPLTEKGGVDRFPPGAHLLVLPHAQRRDDAEDLTGARIAAVVLTPFTVAFDVVTFPLQAVYAVTHR